MPDIKPPKRLVTLKKAAQDASSDDSYLRTQQRVYGHSIEKQVEWDIICALAEKRKLETQKAYEQALHKHLRTVD
jgi:hypothetical protein